MPDELEQVREDDDLLYVVVRTRGGTRGLAQRGLGAGEIAELALQHAEEPERVGFERRMADSDGFSRDRACEIEGLPKLARSREALRLIETRAHGDDAASRRGLERHADARVQDRRV